MWEETTLAAHAEVTVGHVGPMATEYRDAGIPFLRSLNVRPHRIDWSDMKFIDPAFHERLRKSALAPGDVVTVRTGKPGQTAVIPAEIPVANCSDVVVTRPGRTLDARWLSYQLNWLTDTHIAGYLVGAVQQHFNVASAKAIKLLLPPLAEQHAIAEVFGALDDKIAANERVAESADRLARATATSRLSNDLIPLASVADITMGSSPPGTSYNEAGEGEPFYQGVRDFGFRSPSKRVFTTAPVRMARPGDTLLSVRAPVGRVNVADQHLCLGRGLAGLRSRESTPWTLLHQVAAADAVWAPYNSEGTVFGAINKRAVGEAQVPCVSLGNADALEAELSKLEATIAAALAEARLLAGTRDALLPLLMSGRLWVNEATDLVVT